MFACRSLIASCLIALPLSAAEKVSYFKDVRPIFQQNCQGCHQPAKAQGGYVMTEHAALVKPGDSGKPGVAPGKPKQSFLLDEIRVHDGKAEMPKNGTPLTKDQFELIERWITEGAADDTPASANAKLIDADHPPVYHSPPVITSLAYSPGGTYLAVAGYHEILIYDTKDWKLESRLVGLSERVQSVAFSSDGTMLAAAAGDPGRFGEVQIWDMPKRKLKVSAPLTFDTLYGVSWSPDDKLVAVGCIDNTVRAIDPKTGKQVLQMGTHSDWVLGTVFSRDGLHLASVSRDMSMKLTEVTTQRFVDNVTSITPGALKGGLICLDARPMAEKKMAKVPDDTPGAPAKAYDELLVGGADGIPRLYKMHRETKRVIGDDANKIRQYDAVIGRISSLKFDREGKSFATASSLDGVGEVAFFNVDSGKKTNKAEKIDSPAFAVAWSPDGKQLASAGFAGKVWIHDPATGKLVKEFTVMPK